MKAENTKERKREEKERMGDGLDWLNFFVFLERPGPVLVLVPYSSLPPAPQGRKSLPDVFGL